MANRRMFAKSIIDKDAFTEMPHSAQLLYFYLGMDADDEGFLDNYNGIMRKNGFKVDDLKLLIAKGFVIGFDSGIIVIRDWRIHNQIRNDRFHPTKHLQERAQLQLLTTAEYALINSGCQLGNQMATEVSQDKSSKGKFSIGEPARASACEDAPTFTPPSIDEIKAFCKENNIAIDVDCFYNYYECRGWLVSDKPVKNWQALVKCWLAREGNQRSQQTSSKTKVLIGGRDMERRPYSEAELNALFTELDE